MHSTQFTVTLYIWLLHMDVLCCNLVHPQRAPNISLVKGTNLVHKGETGVKNEVAMNVQGRRRSDLSELVKSKEEHTSDTKSTQPAPVEQPSEPASTAVTTVPTESAESQPPTHMTPTESAESKQPTHIASTESAESKQPTHVAPTESAESTQPTHVAPTESPESTQPTHVASTESAESQPVQITPPTPTGSDNLKHHFPNPGNPETNLNSSETKDLIRLLMNNPLISQKLSNAMGNPGVKIGDLRGGCIMKDTKFPTINLKVKGGSPGGASSKKSGEIRINKFYGVKRDRFYIRNSGNGMISIKFEPEELTTEATIRGEGWNDEYVLAKGDLYWSVDNNHGAQHAISDQSYALELQLVHYAKASGSLEKAAKQSNGIVVTSILFEATGKPSSVVEPLANAAASVALSNPKWKQVHGPLDLKMFYPTDMTYYTYIGQYINEPCVTNALWVVFRQPMIASYYQLQKFREVRSQDSKRSTGLFLPLASSFGNKRDVESSGDGDARLIVVNEVVLNRAPGFKQNACFLGNISRKYLEILIYLTLLWNW